MQKEIKSNVRKDGYQNRNLKIQPRCRLNQFSKTVFPEIRLSGNWLEKIGFHSGMKIAVKGKSGVIEIRPQK